MLLHRAHLRAAEQEEPWNTMISPALRIEGFRPLSVRIRTGQAELCANLEKLKDLIGEADFDQYIESILSLRRHDRSLWVVTDHEMHRSLLERNFIRQIQQAFDVDSVRIMSQA